MSAFEEWTQDHTMWRRADGYVVFYFTGGMWMAQAPNGRTISHDGRTKWSTPSDAAAYIDTKHPRTP